VVLLKYAANSWSSSMAIRTAEEKNQARLARPLTRRGREDPAAAVDVAFSVLGKSPRNPNDLTNLIYSNF
jgi:hypothetical protein